eukprot:scaffold74470_cov51-Phaeocystis_antarctica.AAC.2
MNRGSCGWRAAKRASGSCLRHHASEPTEHICVASDPTTLRVCGAGAPDTRAPTARASAMWGTASFFSRLPFWSGRGGERDNAARRSPCAEMCQSHTTEYSSPGPVAAYPEFPLRSGGAVRVATRGCREGGGLESEAGHRLSCASLSSACPSVCLPHHRKPVIAIVCVSIATEVEAVTSTCSSASWGLRGEKTRGQNRRMVEAAEAESAFRAELFRAQFPWAFSTRQRATRRPLERTVAAEAWVCLSSRWRAAAAEAAAASICSASARWLSWCARCGSIWKAKGVGIGDFGRRLGGAPGLRCGVMPPWLCSGAQRTAVPKREGASSRRWSKAMESAALEAASSSTRGSDWGALWPDPPL